MRFLRKGHNSQSEIIRNYQLLIKDEIKKFKNNHVKKYILSCLNQSIEFTENYYKTNIDISPLIGFYAILNLAKVHIIITLEDYNINITDVNKMYKSHGASSTSIDKIKLNRKTGTFIEFAKLYFPNYTSLITSEITLNNLYSNLSDLNSLYNKIYNSKK